MANPNVDMIIGSVVVRGDIAINLNGNNINIGLKKRLVKLQYRWGNGKFFLIKKP